MNHKAISRAAALACAEMLRQAPPVTVATAPPAPEPLVTIAGVRCGTVAYLSYRQSKASGYRVHWAGKRRGMQ